MKAFLAFSKKEIFESVRTYKLFIMGVVFMLLGMMNPLTAKFLPKLLDSFMPAGMQIILTEPSAIDSWTQFFKNIPNMGFIVMVIIFSGILSNELSKGSLIPILTKGLPRRTVILAKFITAGIIYSASFLLCFLTSYLYTIYFFPNDSTINLGLSILCLWIFGMLLIAILILAGTLFKSSYGCLLSTGIFTVFLFLLQMIPALSKYNPLSLTTKNMGLLTGEIAVSYFTIPIIIAILLIFGSVTVSILTFNKKQL